MGRLTFWIIGLVILGAYLYTQQPNMYSKTYGFAWDKAKGLYSGYTNKNVETTEPLNQDIIEGNQVVTPECGKIFGLPFDTMKNGQKYTFKCTDNFHCSTRYSSMSLCNFENGECYMGC